MTERTIRFRIDAIPTADGAGVKLRRSLGAQRGLHLDPFLMLDEFSSDDPDDYIAGFPPHPHRGFETVTYMLDGRMEHKDHMGNTGRLDPGGVQWMTAGRGVIHSEMPRQREGRLRGFQLWINLPAAEKMRPADYRDLAPEAIPESVPAEGVHVRAIAGQTRVIVDDAESILRGAVNPDRERSTDPLLVDVALDAGRRLTVMLEPGHNAFVYAIDGVPRVVREDDAESLSAHTAGLLGPGDRVTLAAPDDAPARMLLLAAKPIGEPVVQYGPFVMNTREEIEQALADYRAGTLTAA
ncbi:pirin family protein [Wenzhouxiangella sp. XN79A]|uniref:pirin family protein n=1 Tax=Wenzhouxiangella sp. XN79A TaxID=2724193 RepID=UPI00144A5C06|nr:pirin family protein [Wenzhouxiangella sp. XN79A]NKI34420.1 pirin family protein [Wenzhouxiangella sp. XN79A]